MKLHLLICILIFSFAISADIKINDSPIASLTFFLGAVKYKIKSATDGQWLPVKKGIVFHEGDILKTQEDGKAELYFYSGSKLRVANGTEIEFTKDEKSKEKNILLNIGQIWNQVRKGDKFNVETVNGVASVKGTEYGVGNNKDQMDVWVAEGLVQIQNQNGLVLAEKNTHTTLKKDDKPEKSDIKKSDIPSWKDDFNAEAILMTNSPGNKTENKPFKIILTLKNPKTDRLFNGEVLASIESQSKALSLASEEGSTAWNSKLDIKIIEGKAEFYAKASAGKAEITITGKSFTGMTIPFEIKGITNARTVTLTVLDRNNKERTITLKYKLK